MARQRIARKLRYICHGEPDCECWAYESSDETDPDATCENCGHDRVAHIGTRKCRSCGEPLDEEFNCTYCGGLRE